MVVSDNVLAIASRILFFALSLEEIFFNVYDVSLRSQDTLNRV